jgi:hypothetical protein
MLLYELTKVGRREKYGDSVCVQSIEVLSLQENNFMGELPMSWAALGRFPALGYLELWKNSLSGAVPAAWGNYNAFPALRSLCAHPSTSLRKRLMC